MCDHLWLRFVGSNSSYSSLSGRAGEKTAQIKLCNIYCNIPTMSSSNEYAYPLSISNAAIPTVGCKRRYYTQTPRRHINSKRIPQSLVYVATSRMTSLESIILTNGTSGFIFNRAYGSQRRLSRRRKNTSE